MQGFVTFADDGHGCKGESGARALSIPSAHGTRKTPPIFSRAVSALRAKPLSEIEIDQEDREV